MAKTKGAKSHVEITLETLIAEMGGDLEKSIVVSKTWWTKVQMDKIKNGGTGVAGGDVSAPAPAETEEIKVETF